jgi:hypothetical protein
MCSFYQRLASWKKVTADRLEPYPLSSLLLHFFYLSGASTSVICVFSHLFLQRLLRYCLVVFSSILIDPNNTQLMIEVLQHEVWPSTDALQAISAPTLPPQVLSFFYWLFLSFLVSLR